MDKTLLTLHEAAALEGKHFASIRAWFEKGVAGQRLQVEYRGRTPLTTAEWLEDFHARVTAAKAEKRQRKAEPMPAPEAEKPVRRFAIPADERQLAVEERMRARGCRI